LNGGIGADAMFGGTGNDTYIVDNTGDVVTEAVGEGTADMVKTSVSYTLAAGSEVETLSGTGAVGLTLRGNEFANTVNGTNGASPNDTLFGGAGNDTLNGGLGADVMAGGIGNDTYFVDNALDVVTENAGEGTDTIWAGSNYALTAASEVEFLRANAATGLTLTGNALTDNITGNLGNDTLGDAGNDTLTGGAGDDVLDGANNDTMFGNAGNDMFRFRRLWQ
jgi:Ca2+-binding RTX toxin-like protein